MNDLRLSAYQNKIKRMVLPRIIPNLIRRFELIFYDNRMLFSVAQLFNIIIIENNKTHFVSKILTRSYVISHCCSLIHTRNGMCMRTITSCSNTFYTKKKNVTSWRWFLSTLVREVIVFKCDSFFFLQFICTFVRT